MAQFGQIECESIANALGHTTLGLTGTQIAHLLRTLRMPDPDPGITKRLRLLDAFAADQNKRGNRTGILELIRRAMAPASWLQKKEQYEPLRSILNEALALAGLALSEAGKIYEVERASTISEAERRADYLRTKLIQRRVHPDVLKFCTAELLADNYFHVVLEAVKSVADKLRNRTGILDDGGELVARAFGGDAPL